MFVAIPTAIPVLPFASKFGNADGNTIGSCSTPSYVLIRSIVSSDISFSIISASGVSRASVYLIAAALSPSMFPKFPCPSTNGYLVENP